MGRHKGNVYYLWKGTPGPGRPSRLQTLPTRLVQREYLLCVPSNTMVWKRLYSPALPDIRPCPPAQWKLLWGLFVLKQLCQQRVNSLARSSTAHLGTGEFQTGGFRKEKAWTQGGNFRVLSDLLLRAESTTSNPDSFQHTASFWSETNGPQLPDRPLTRSQRTDKSWPWGKKLRATL